MVVEERKSNQGYCNNCKGMLGHKSHSNLGFGLWEDIGTIEAFYNANLGITKKPVPDFR